VRTQTFKPKNGQSDGSWRNESSMRNNQIRPSHNHDSAAPRQHPLICTGAGLIHPVHGQPMSLATKAIHRNKVTFSPFLRAFLTRCNLDLVSFCVNRFWGRRPDGITINDALQIVYNLESKQSTGRDEGFLEVKHWCA